MRPALLSLLLAAAPAPSAPTPAPAPVQAPAPAPAPQPILTAPLTFSAAGPVNGVIPVCTGSYQIDPYYPTLSLLTVYVQASSVNVPDGTPLTITVYGAGGTLYPFTSSSFLLLGGSGSLVHNEYITPGTSVVGVVVSDMFGNAVFAGN
ncbi:MAG TPA: hypothetical protein DCM86_04030 [Verrucomicrobiales bacterium]|nr:hypothetical protein [Verrucomicrobiales bacterium]